MKLNGQTLEGKCVQEIYIPRGEGGDEGVMFRVEAINDLESFEELCPEPKPRMIRRPGETPVPDLQRPEYVKKMEEHSRKRLAYFIIKGLAATEGLE